MCRAVLVSSSEAYTRSAQSQIFSSVPGSLMKESVADKGSEASRTTMALAERTQSKGFESDGKRSG